MQEPISQQIARLTPLCHQLQGAATLNQKLAILEKLTSIPQELLPFIDPSNILDRYVILSVCAIGQADILLDIQTVKDPQEPIKTLIQQLQDLEKFYDFMGGIIGYHLSVLTLLIAAKTPQKELDKNIRYEEPNGIDITPDNAEIRKIIRWGIESLPMMSEIYPLGGAGDRLNLIDETGHPLPAAQLPFCGRPLVEGLIRDLQGREFLYYKLFGKQITTPIAMMTSHEKDNRHRIEQLCEAHGWFNRPKASFDIFVQVRVPMLTTEGNWAMVEPLKPLLKPGGHGALWKAAADAGVFARLKKSNHNKMLIRQINNPVAGTDKGLLTLIGIGCHENKAFGFASCPRLLNMPEGMDVLLEKKQGNHYECCITNIEYTDFKQRGIEDAPKEPKSRYSQYPANTNILFADLPSLESALRKCPLPGLLINIKSEADCYLSGGSCKKYSVARLESTMQNIADYIVDKFDSPFHPSEFKRLSTFLTYNERRKTLSTTKQTYQPGQHLSGTPEGCFYEMMQNYHELLSKACRIAMPPPQEESDYLTHGPDTIVLFHPALGGLYSIIAQKIHEGRVGKGSEWIMEIAEAEVINLDLQGNLIVEAKAIMGTDQRYDSSRAGKCTLINTTVRNRGSRSIPPQNAWKHQPERLEQLSITIWGNGEFYAKDVTFTGNLTFEVRDGERLTVSMEHGKLTQHSTKISRASWQWDYTFDNEDRIVLKQERGQA